MNERAKQLASRILSQVADEPFEDVMGVLAHIHVFLILDQAADPILTVDGRPTGEARARYYWLLLAEWASDPAAVRRHAAEDLGATGARRIAGNCRPRTSRKETEQRKKRSKGGEVSAKYLRNQGLQSVPCRRLS